MHSSMMRTVRSSGRLLGGLPGGSVSPAGISAQGGCLPGRGHLPRGCVSQHTLGQTPLRPVERKTDRCKNITFPQIRLWTVITS